MSRPFALSRATAFVALTVTAVAGAPLRAQEPVRPGGAGPDTTATDTAATDTAGIARLPDLNVTATRSEAPLERVPYAVGSVGREDLQRAQLTVGLDEALSNIPGVVVSNRYNFSVGQRVTIRGFGSRSNFGVRGLKVLLDGVPQTLPDGQTQFENVDFAALSRAEVLRGSSSALHGNASGGVISLVTEPAAPGRFAQRVRVQGGGGEDGGDEFYKVQSWTSGRAGNVSGTLSLSQFQADGFRQHSEAEIRQLNLGADWLVSGATAASLRLSTADAPRAQNPGALTLPEYLANPDSASPTSIRRGADKDVEQHQLALGLRHFDAAGNEYSVTLYGILRDLLNPIATPPPDPTGPTAGTYITIDRQVAGARLTARRRLGGAEASPELIAGADVQRQRDDRLHVASDAGRPTAEILLDQREKALEVGPFVQVQWSPDPRLLLSVGGRYDWVRFDVRDRFLADGRDDSGDRTLQAASGNVGASWSFGDALVPYVNVGTSFETPTTNELLNRPDERGGFNEDLDPQRAVNFEVGARGRPHPAVSYSVALFLSRVSDALVPFQTVEQRSFFRNAGKTHNDGAEVGLSLAPAPWLTVSGAWTYAHYRFADYVVVSGETADTLDGNRLPGVPEHFWRFGARSEFGGGFFADADHTISSSVAADDANTIFVGSWGEGVTNLRLGWAGDVGSVRLAPFVGVNNAWDRRYIASVALNGVGGRVIEPAPGRVIYVGAEVGYQALP